MSIARAIHILAWTCTATGGVLLASMFLACVLDGVTYRKTKRADQAGVTSRDS